MSRDGHVRLLERARVCACECARANQFVKDGSSWQPADLFAWKCKSLGNVRMLEHTQPGFLKHAQVVRKLQIPGCSCVAAGVLLRVL